MTQIGIFLVKSASGLKESVFEFGLGESTRLAAAANVIRYTGVDSDATYVSKQRRGLVTINLYLPDIGQTRQGHPKEIFA